MTTDTLTETGNEPADILINTIYTSPIIPVEAARLMEASVRAAISTERRATIARIKNRVAHLRLNPTTVEGDPELEAQDSAYSTVLDLLDAEANR